jgi:hypothetical protein
VWGVHATGFGRRNDAASETTSHNGARWRRHGAGSRSRNGTSGTPALLIGAMQAAETLAARNLYSSSTIGSELWCDNRSLCAEAIVTTTSDIAFRTVLAALEVVSK